MNLAASKKGTKKAGVEALEKTSAGAEGEQQEQEELRADLLDDFLFHSANYIYVRRKLFITLAVAVLVIIFAIYGTFTALEYRDNQRNEQLYQIEKIIYNAALTEADQIKQVMPLLDDFISQHGETKQANLAIFYRAGLRFKQSKLEEAENDLKSVLTSVESGSDLYVLANLYLVNVLKDQKKIEEALENLQALKTAAKSDAMIDIILMEQAELYMSREQSQKAKQVLEILLKDYPKSLYAGKAKQLLEIL